MMGRTVEPIPLAAVEHNDRLRAIEQAIANQNERLDRGSQRMDLMQAGMAEMQAELRSNTEVTTDVRDILGAVRTGLRVLGGLGTAAQWAGRLAAAGVALYGAFYALTHGGRPPGAH